MEVEAAVFPGIDDLHPFGWQLLLLNQQVHDLGMEEFLQRLQRRL
jgi:hypothetical protein